MACGKIVGQACHFGLDRCDFAEMSLGVLSEVLVKAYKVVLVSFQRPLKGGLRALRALQRPKWRYKAVECLVREVKGHGGGGSWGFCRKSPTTRIVQRCVALTPSPMSALANQLLGVEAPKNPVMQS